jgi:hypothetical protein
LACDFVTDLLNFRVWRIDSRQQEAGNSELTTIMQVLQELEAALNKIIA